MRNMTLDEFVDFMRGAVNQYYTEQLKIDETSEEYVHEAGELEWLEWFTFFMEDYEG